MKYAYPAIFTEEDRKVLVEVPDLPHTFTFGDDMADAIFMTQDAMAMWLLEAETQGWKIPEPSKIGGAYHGWRCGNSVCSL